MTSRKYKWSSSLEDSWAASSWKLRLHKMFHSLFLNFSHNSLTRGSESKISWVKHIEGYLHRGIQGPFHGPSKTTPRDHSMKWHMLQIIGSFHWDYIWGRGRGGGGGGFVRSENLPYNGWSNTVKMVPGFPCRQSFLDGQIQRRIPEWYYSHERPGS